MIIHPVGVIQCLVIVSAANYAPILCKQLLGKDLDAAIDGGLIFQDGHRYLGSSKTWRGIAAAIILSTIASLLLDLPWQMGALAGASAMAGDCASSFTKRRLGIEPGDMSFGLDQVPESLLPALASGLYIPLSLLDVAAIVLMFFVGQVVFSRLLFIVGLRDRPY